MPVALTSLAPPYLEVHQQTLSQQTSRNILDCPVHPFATPALERAAREAPPGIEGEKSLATISVWH
jgi:hypothetical protein